MIELVKTKPVGAIILSARGDAWDQPCRIIGVLWEGGTTAGDRAVIMGRGPSKMSVIWPARTDTGNTYLGAIWGPPGIHAPDGFRAEVLDAGTLYVYLSE